MSRTLLFDPSADLEVIDGTEAVTLYRRQAHDTFDGGTAVASAFRRAASKTEIQGLGMVADRGVVWHLWASQAGTPEPKAGDVVQDADSARWAVLSVDVQAYETRYRLTTVRER